MIAPDKIGLAILAIVIIGVSYLVVFAEDRHSVRQDKCESLGGVYFRARDGSICLKKESVISLKEVK